MLTVHGRTREQGYKGQAEYDHDCRRQGRLCACRWWPMATSPRPEKALAVLRHTGADALMVGRAAQGRPWISGDIAHYLATGKHLRRPLVERGQQLAAGPPATTTTACTASSPACAAARKHIGWYVRALPGGEAFRRRINALRRLRRAGPGRGRLF